MSNPPFTNTNNALLQARLNRTVAGLRNLSYPTREEYQAEVFNQVDRVFDTGYGMSELPLVAADTPAKISDFENPVSVLNNDGIDIINELNRIENLISQFYNLAAASENQLRQTIRTNMNASSKTRFYEGFLDTTQIDSSSTGSLDANAADYTAGILSTTVLTPTVTIGPASIGSIASGSLDQISSTSPTSFFSWNGNTLELIFTFSSPTPLNRIYLKQYDYKDIGITNLVSSPDGTYLQDILAELEVSVLLCGVTSNKSSGESNIDFTPKSCKTLTMTIQDQTGTGTINLDFVQLIQRQFKNSAVLNSTQITAPLGTLVFNAETIQLSPYTSIVHQISFDGTSYQNITSGSSVTIPGNTYWYRGTLSTNTSLVNSSGPPINAGLSPGTATYYSVSNITSIPLGNNLIEKILAFNTISGPVTILDPVIVATLVVQVGASILSGGAYTFSNGVLTLTTPANNVTVTYQINASTTSVASLANFFSPIFVSYSFEAI